MSQYNFKFNHNISFTHENYIISKSNKTAYDILINQNINTEFVFLFGPEKSGKSHISTIWQKNNSAQNYIINDLKIDEIVNIDCNVLIDNFFDNLNEEKSFYLINHCKSNNLKILITSNIYPNAYKFKSKDLSSRIKSFYLIEITKPDDYLLSNLIVKLFNDRQIFIKNDDIINFILTRTDRSFENVYTLVKKIDKYSLTHKREITIPLIKNII